MNTLWMAEEHKQHHMKAYVDRDLCVGCGVCAIICPEVFRMEGGKLRGYAVVHLEEAPQKAQCFCRDARDCCQPDAIVIKVDENRRKHPIAYARAPARPPPNG